MENFFQKICNSFSEVDQCLANCESNRKGSTLAIRQTYSGLRYICIDEKSDFFNVLPCLAEYEPSAMVKCRNEINQSHVTTSQFTESIVNREIHNIKPKFRDLCKDLSIMIKCMEPVIRNGCGDKPTDMMLKFISLEFASFEQLYSQLGFSEPLPSP
uniref:Chondroitin proteoglycan 4 domain-containing protein n=1 Tax=Acrobeloides nanus TaxID=290746 RepID=A0A914DMT3_9BILA